jgi:hypothetical protein
VALGVALAGYDFLCGGQAVLGVCGGEEGMECCSEVLLDGGVRGEKLDGPEEGGGGGVVAGDEEAEELEHRISFHVVSSGLRRSCVGTSAAMTSP